MDVEVLYEEMRPYLKDLHLRKLKKGEVDDRLPAIYEEVFLPYKVFLARFEPGFFVRLREIAPEDDTFDTLEELKRNLRARWFETYGSTRKKQRKT